MKDEGRVAINLLFYTSSPVVEVKTTQLSCLVKTDTDVTLDAGSEVNLSLQVELDTNEESSRLELSVVVSGAPQELAYEKVSKWVEWILYEAIVTYQRAERDRWRWAEERRTGSCGQRQLGDRHGPGHQTQSRSGKRRERQGWTWPRWSYSRNVKLAKWLKGKILRDP